MASATLNPLVFSSVNGLDGISLDYILPPDASPSSPVPILIWWHGGGLLRGTRKTMPPHLLSASATHNLCMISADYSLAPQTRLPGILADLASLMAFVRSLAFKSATGGCADASKIVVSGGSAGGWLALLVGTGVGFEVCGIEVPEKPLGVCAIYPISALKDPFWSMVQRPVSFFPRVIGKSELEEFLDPSTAVTTDSPVGGPQGLFYHYMVQEGILSSLLLDGTGIDLKAFSIAPALASGAFTAPPTFIIHGTIDDKIPIQQSIDVVNALEANSSEVEFEVREGSDHLFDFAVEEEMVGMYEFIKRVCA